MRSKGDLNKLLCELYVPKGVHLVTHEDGTKLTELNPEDNTSYLVTIKDEGEGYAEGFVIHPWSRKEDIEGKFKAALIEFRRRGMIQ